MQSYNVEVHIGDVVLAPAQGCEHGTGGAEGPRHRQGGAEHHGCVSLAVTFIPAANFLTVLSSFPGHL